MPKQNKPSEEELKAKEEEAIKVAEELENRQSIPEDEEDPEGEEELEEVIGDDDKVVVEEEQEEEDQAEPSKEIYKKKFKASSRENQKINAKNRVLNKALADAQDVNEPTEEELKAQYGDDWDLMSDIDRKLVKETEISKRWRNTIAQAKEQATKIEKWNDDVENFINDPKTLNDNPDLEGKEQEFIDFAVQDENNNVPMKILIGAFLHEQSSKKTENKGRMFERGKGGSKEKMKSRGDTITLEEARKLRETNYAKYKEYLTANKIVSDL